MMRYVLSAIIMVVVLSGCQTTASFILPPNTDLVIDNERVAFNSTDEEGRAQYARRPFFWTSIAGIEYKLVRDEKIIKQAKLPSSFRIEAIFWPPYALIYWPVGFEYKCYDLSDPDKEFIEDCSSNGSAKKPGSNSEDDSFNGVTSF